jgi:uncharacterized protein (TIGR02996 family)
MSADVLTRVLAQALAAFGRSEDEEALGLLLDAWRKVRVERLAALAMKLSDRLTAGPPLRPTDLSRMSSGLLETASRGDAEPLCRQLEALRGIPADPRLIPLVRAIACLPVARRVDVLGPLRDLLLHLQSPGTEQDCQALLRARDTGTSYEEALAVFNARPEAEEMPALEVTLPAEAERLCDELEQALARRDAPEARAASLREALLARVYAHPDDDAARMVLADHLLEQGDPLGEFIMHQCSAQPDGGRIQELKARHGLAWQAPLGPYIHPQATRFERGFPVAVQMNFAQMQQPELGPAWGTVRELDWGASWSPLSASWFTQPHLHAVTRLRGLHPFTARRLGAYPLPVRRLELHGRTRVDDDMFVALSALPHLTWVEVTLATPRLVRLCALSPMAGRLERFTAMAPDAWLLTAAPREDVPVSVMLLNAERCISLASAIRAADGFGTRALRIQLRGGLSDGGRRMLQDAASAYARVEWE